MLEVQGEVEGVARAKGDVEDHEPGGGGAGGERWRRR